MTLISAVTTERLSLAGSWHFGLGTPEPVFPQRRLPALALNDSVMLPGTTETNRKGPENLAHELGGLTRVRKFEGAAWYQREIDVPADWAGRRIELRLERTKYTQVWWDDQPMGERRLFTAPQVYDLTACATAGRHRLTIMVDNRVERLPFLMVNVHQFNSDHTQTNWNGVLGRIELVARPALWMTDVQVGSDLAGKAFHVRVAFGALPGTAVGGRVMVRAESFNHPGEVERTATIEREVTTADAAGGVKLTLPLGEGAKLWDEFSPALYKLTVTLESGAGRDEREIEVGLREFRTHGTQFTINGRTTFLRGRHEGGTFPLTGHPPMDVEGWMAHFRINQRYGLNHVRCHTWTPPEAAFIAANRLGIYLQSELPFWGTFDERARDFLMPEAEAMLRAYGNHPSFVMLTLANEAGGDRGLMNAMVQRLRERDGRRLYSDGCNNLLSDVRHQPTNDFWVTAKTRTPATGERQVPARGSFYFADGYDGVLQWDPSVSTRADLSAATASLPVPVVGHEIGQYTVYPDYREIAKYTGVTRARNFEHFRDVLARRGRLDQADDFFRASGALMASLYREDIELSLRTATAGGFQLLDLQDYPGQGTALVGILDAFMDSKGLVTPERWREFCGAVVPLARFDRTTWTTTDTFVADLELAHYSAADLREAKVRWRIADSAGATLAEGVLPLATIASGGLRKLGRVETSLARVVAPARLELVVAVASGEQRYENRWPLWVYPAAVNTEPPANVTVVRAFDERTKALLAGGERVVLMPDGEHRGSTLRGAYATDFWCWPMFNSAPGTMGLLIRPEHPALARFPTRTHSERQWSRIAHASAPVILADAPPEFRPIVQVIDNLARNELLGLVFEARVGAGSLLVVASDLPTLSNAPEARQLWASLLAYAGSPAFAPKQTLSAEVLERCLRPAVSIGRPASASSTFTPPWGPAPKPESAVDGDINTRWQAAADDAAPWLAVDLGAEVALSAVELRWLEDEAGYAYRIEGSVDGRRWDVLSDQQKNAFDGGRHFVPVNGAVARHVRVVVAGSPAGKPIGLRDVRVLGAQVHAPAARL